MARSSDFSDEDTRGASSKRNSDGQAACVVNCLYSLIVVVVVLILWCLLARKVDNSESSSKGLKKGPGKKGGSHHRSIRESDSESFASDHDGGKFSNFKDNNNNAGIAKASKETESAATPKLDLVNLETPVYLKATHFAQECRSERLSTQPQFNKDALDRLLNLYQLDKIPAAQGGLGDGRGRVTSIYTDPKDPNKKTLVEEYEFTEDELARNFRFNYITGEAILELEDDFGRENRHKAYSRMGAFVGGSESNFKEQRREFMKGRFFVNEVYAGGLAEKNGIKPGDEIRFMWLPEDDESNESKVFTQESLAKDLTDRVTSGPELEAQLQKSKGRYHRFLQDSKLGGSEDVKRGSGKTEAEMRQLIHEKRPLVLGFVQHRVVGRKEVPAGKEGFVTEM